MGTHEPARGRTTPDSTPGSFAPRTHSAPATKLAAPAASTSGEPTSEELDAGNPVTYTAVRDLIWGEASDINRALRDADGTYDPRDRSTWQPRHPEALAHAQGRATVLREVAILCISDHTPDYNVSSDFRRVVLAGRGTSRIESVDLPSRYGADTRPDGLAEQRAISPQRAAAIRDFCFEQAARFASDTWGAPRPDQRDQHAYMDEEEWAHVQEGRSYAVGLTESYAHWALAFHTGADTDPSDYGNLMRALYDRTTPDRPSHWGDAADRDHSQAWDRMTGLGADVSHTWRA